MNNKTRVKYMAGFNAIAIIFFGMVMAEILIESIWPKIIIYVCTAIGLYWSIQIALDNDIEIKKADHY